MFKETDTPGKQALNRFLDTNDTERQFAVLMELGVTSPDEEKRKDVFFVFQMALRRIASRGLQTEFWDAMNKHYGDWYENPFVYWDMLSAIESPSNVKQNIHCPQCGRQWRIRSEYAVAVCKFGRCVKCLTEEKVRFDADSIRIYSYDVDRGMKSRSQIIAEHAEMVKAWKKADNIDRDKELQADKVAASQGVAADELDAFREPGKAEPQRGPAEGHTVFGDAVAVFEQYGRWLDVTAEAKLKADILMNTIRRLTEVAIPQEEIDKSQGA